MNITIKNISPSDIPEVRALGLATPELQIDNNDPQYYPEEILRSFITSPDDIYLVAKVDDVLAGYFLATYNPYLKEAYLIDMVVKNEFRNQKIATLFFNKTLEILKEKGCEWAWTLVHEDNSQMMQILEKKGFLKGRKFQFFYKGDPL